MPLYVEMSQNINKTIRHLKFCYISILTNLLRIYTLTPVKDDHKQTMQVNTLNV